MRVAETVTRLGAEKPWDPQASVGLGGGEGLTQSHHLQEGISQGLNPSLPASAAVAADPQSIFVVSGAAPFFLPV
jgi:hypothetical protein